MIAGVVPGVLGAALAAAIPASATSLGGEAALHTRLLFSQPAANDTLREAPQTIRLVFSAPVSAELSRIVLAGGAGEPLVLRVSPDSTNPQAVIAAAPALEPGSYRVTWRVVSPDGHPVSGDFVFHVAAAVGRVGPHGDSRDTAAPPLPESPPAQYDLATAGAGPARVSAAAGMVGVASLMGLVGLVAFATGLAPGTVAPPRRLVTLLAVAAPGAFTVHFAAWLVSIVPDPLGPEAIRAALVRGPGRLEAIRVALALLVPWAALLARRPGLAGVIALAGLAVGGAIGHAATISPVVSVPANTAHLLAASVWLGGLLFLVFGHGDHVAFAAAARRVSTVALIAVAAVALTGAWQVWLFLPRLSDLWTSEYGILVLAKTAGLGALVAFGAWHRIKLLPAAIRGDARPLRLSVRREVLVMTAVIVVAGILAHVPPPATGSPVTVATRASEEP